jgi:phosphohistidine phosphatase SixA
MIAHLQRLQGATRLWPAILVNALWRCMGAAALTALLLAAPGRGSAADEAALWDALRSGTHVALLRHAIAPGTGDPDNFTLGDCSTQRNLSEEGRAQAARIGARFRANRIETARVFSSQWCRCLETAKLLELGEVQELPLLNSFFADSDQRDPQTQALKTWLAEQEPQAPIVLVTHQVNITALTGVYPNSGEMVVVGRSAAGAIEVAGTIAAD